VGDKVTRQRTARARKILTSAVRHESTNDLGTAARLYKDSERVLSRCGRDRKVAALRVRSLSGLAFILRLQGRYKQSENVYRKALRLAERTLGPTHLDVSTVLNDLGVLFKYAGRFTEAGQIYQRALAITEQRLGSGHPDVATVYHNLGGLEHAAGNFARAEAFARHALKLRRKAQGTSRPELALEMAALAPILDGRRRFAAAARLYRRALPVLERTYGAGHPDVTAAFNNFAANAQARGRPAEAERIYRRTLAAKEQFYGPEHPAVGTTLNNLAVLLKQRKKYDDADVAFRRAVSIFERALGPRHLNTAAVLDNYAQLLRRMRRAAYAKTLEARAGRIRKGIETLSDGNVAVTATLNPQMSKFNLSVRPSPIHRWGVYAEEDIPPRRKVIVYDGERVSRRAARSRFNPNKIYLYALDGRRSIDGASGGSGAEFINHCCAPNLVARASADAITFFSVRNIRAGDELTVDYKFEKRARKIACRCGAPTCRGTINRV
jgi:tetratricopeptide (TPR) repeat protein